MRKESFVASQIPSGFHWHCEPSSWQCGSGLQLVTDRETDFWQRTHYGFRRDNGHCLFMEFEGDFCVSTHVRFTPQTQYDQCGLMVRANAEQWIKLSTEYEDAQLSRLGSVVTNFGYSDWATQDVSSEERERWYRVTRKGNDFFLESADDGKDWRQLRVAHLHNAPQTLEVGPYACSPIGEAFTCCFTFLETVMPTS